MAREYMVTMSSKGQVTLPADLRRALVLARGVRLRVLLRDDGTIEVTKPPFTRVADLAGLGERRDVPLPPSKAREQAYVERWQAKQERSR
jgi:AbrB family looped-hinge helix DNA binding protein